MPFFSFFILLGLSQIWAVNSNFNEGIKQLHTIPRQYHYDYYPWRDNYSIL